MTLSQVAWGSVDRLSAKKLSMSESVMEEKFQRLAQSFNPNQWGFESLEYDEDMLLNKGVLSIKKASGVLPDNSYFTAPLSDLLPEAFSILEQGQLDSLDNTYTIHIALPKKEDLQAQAAPKEPRLERFAVNTIRVENEDVAVAKSKLVLVSGKEKLSNYVSIPLVKVQYLGDNKFKHHETFKSPVYLVKNSPSLLSNLKEVQLVIAKRSQELAQLCAAMGSHGMSLTATHVDLSLLEVLNEINVYLQCAQGFTKTHPEDLFYKLCELYGKACTYLKVNRLVDKVPLYEHENMGQKYAALFHELAEILNTQRERPAFQVSLVRDHSGFYYAQGLPKGCVSNYDMILIVGANDDPNPEIAVSASYIREFFNSQSLATHPSLALEFAKVRESSFNFEVLTTQPPFLPYFYNAVYFRFAVRENSDMNKNTWKKVNEGGDIAILPVSTCSEARIQLWVVDKLKSGVYDHLLMN